MRYPLHSNLPYNESRHEGEKDLISPEPLVRLRNFFLNPTADAVSAAKTCYSSKIVSPEDLSDEDIKTVGKTTYEGGHHTVYQHEMFEFELSNVSRAFVHDFLHTHPFYNSSQSSQRYVRLKEPKATFPPLSDSTARSIFKKAVVRSYEIYEELTNLLIDDISEQYKFALSGKFLGPENIGNKAQREVKEKAMEAARYALSIAAHTHLIHTIDGVTLWRYFRMKNLSWESKIVVSKMIEQVRTVDPNFPRFVEEEHGEYLREVMPEHAFDRRLDINKDGDKVVEEFDRSLDGKHAKLISWTPDAEEVVADCVRQVLGYHKAQLGDLDALDLVLNPSKNIYLIDTLNLSIVSPLTRVLAHALYTFRKKLSHTADSQNQRHRTIPASRPLTFAIDTIEPDYITPELISRNREIRALYDEWMKEIWEQKNKLLAYGVPIEHANYVLPNGLAIRITETGSMLHLWYKYTNRSCLRAQEEIWRITMEEITQINQVHPNLGKYLGPPCFIRKMHHHNREVSEEIGKVKYCNQGRLYCRQPIWDIYPNVSIDNILRV